MSAFVGIYLIYIHTYIDSLSWPYQ